MYGAILGDIIGSPYEFDFNNIKIKDFPLFSERSSFTDDTVMTVAIAEALFECDLDKDYAYNADKIIKSLKKWGEKYPNAGYGLRFMWWLEHSTEPYNSWGNGSAMRVSSVGWLYDSLEDTRKMARITAKVTHNHPEGIKGAEATASAIYLARNGASKEKIKEYISKEFEYNLNRTCDEIRPYYHHIESCQETVPEGITAFLEGKDFEDCIRNAVSLCGDSDTLTCITGSIAEAYYGVPDDLKRECINRLPEEMIRVLDIFNYKKKEKLMGELGRRYGIVFRIRGEGVGRHHLSHIHVSYGEYEASYSIDGKLLAGELPNKKEKEVLEIIEQYKDELIEQLKHVEAGERVERIF